MNSNFRYLYFSLLILIDLATSAIATSQALIINVGSDSVNDRLIQIETIVNSQGKLLYQIQQQLLDDQRDIDILRGQIQENQHQLNEVIQRQKDLYIHIKSLMTNSNKIIKNTDSTNNDDNIIATVKLTNEKDEYDKAVSLAINSKFKYQIVQAINSFQKFIKTYPKSNYQSNANYWLGQLNYNHGNKDDAIFYFAIVVKNYPNSSKVTESFYKIGLLMQEKGQNDKARAVYLELIKIHPNSPSAELARKKLVSL
ncbi:MAG: tol-pal system protein YbgF [Arsenophonus sp. ET-DL9-MAG3]